MALLTSFAKNVWSHFVSFGTAKADDQEEKKITDELKAAIAAKEAAHTATGSAAELDMQAARKEAMTLVMSQNGGVQSSYKAKRVICRYYFKWLRANG